MKAFWFCAAAVAALSMAACSGKSSAVASRDTASVSAPYANSPYAQDTSYSGAGARAVDPRDAPVPQIDGKPLWAANRKHTAEENAQYQFAKNGADFGARSESQYVSAVHDFVDKPPHGIEVIDRVNGDKLMYDPRKNIFAVVARNGAPRTMFKPKSGPSYWTEQKQREAQDASRASTGGSGEG